MLVDSSLAVAWLNPAAENLLGVSLNRAMGQPLRAIGPDLGPLAELCERAQLESKNFSRAINILSPQGDSTARELAARVSLTNDSDAEPLLIELFDITQRHQLDRESKLVAQHGVSRRMIRQLAHEIRNPLGGLRGAAQLLERELPDPALREFTQIIIGEADRLAGLMDDLLGPGRQPAMRQTNVHELLERVATIVESEWPEQTIKRDYDPSLPELYLDRNQLTQAFLNLVRNASQAITRGGQIILRTRVLTNHVVHKTRSRLVAVIEIEDDGPGVPEEIADTLFYPLVSGRDHGTGLGLSLAQDLVSRHKGLIEYESEPGRTIFSVQLPIFEPGPETGNVV